MSTLRKKYTDRLKLQHPGVYIFLKKVYEFRYRVKNSFVWLARVRNYFYYKITMARNLPYFGPVMESELLKAARVPFMEKMIDKEISGPKNQNYKVLEIGSWAGGSAILWAKACQKYGRGKVYCIDHWKASANATKIMKKMVKKNKIFNLFLHNIRMNKLENYIIIMKCSSDDMASVLKNETFNIIYIDGDHSYSQLSEDFHNYKNLVCEDGILCGDDLELTIDAIDLDYAKKHCEEDYIEDPKTRKPYHPGVTLAVSETFKNIGLKNGFWAVKKIRGEWMPYPMD